MGNQPVRETALSLLRFIEASPTAAHAVAAAASQLDEAGFRRVDETDSWKLEPGEAFYVVRGHSALVAGRVGTRPPAEAGFRLAGAHTDAPGLRLKPSAHYVGSGYLQMGVEVYGGPLLATWADRDLTVAGRLYLRQDAGPPRMVLVRGDRPLCRIPLLAIHFQREVNEQGLKLDRQKHLPPIYGLGDDSALSAEPLLAHFAENAGVDLNAIVASDLEIVDTQPPTLGGLDESFIFAPRIDNLAGTHAVLEAMVRAPASAQATRLAALFDSEEIGSQTLAGAGSLFLDAVLERLCFDDNRPREALQRALAHSVMVSVDGAHAVHPNHSDMHDPHHRPMLNGGPVIKVNAQQRYATTGAGLHWFERCAARAEVPVQHYVHRTDLPCGSTIGPMTATRLGVPTVDVGSPMLAMHSIRETGGAQDPLHMIRALVEHYTD